jgi:hypothetical protein
LFEELMPKRKAELSPQEQGEQFKREAQRLIDAGELSPTEADAALDALVRTAATRGPKEKRE